MKKFLLIIILCVCGVIPSMAQLMQFRTQAYSYRQHTTYGWGSWSSWEDSSMYLTINLNTDIVTVYSPVTQIYKVTDYVGTYREGDSTVVEYRFIDQDGDKGTMHLVQKDSGTSFVYIRFANIQWAYIVKRV